MRPASQRFSTAWSLRPSGGARAASRRRGSVLIVALLVAAMLALVLGGYLSLNLGSARLSQRTFDRGAAFHLAEAGLEEGLWTYNRLLTGDTSTWNDWQVSSGSAWRRFDGFALSGSTSGSIKVYAQPVAPTEEARPMVVALASVRSPGGAPVTRMLEVSLRRRSFFAAGIVARESLVFRGRNVSFDSWDSDPDRDPATPRVPYSAEVRLDTGVIATGAAAENLVLNRARIHGRLVTRGLVPELSAPGFVGPFGVEEGEIHSGWLAQDYNDEFPQINAPTDGTFLTQARLGSTLGVPGEATSWRMPSLRLSGKQTLTILGHVTLVLTDPVDALSISGGASLVLSPGSSLALYAEGDISIGGQGIVQDFANPGALQIWSTTRPGQRNPRITISGRGELAALVYAPEADFEVTGNGEFYGSLIARRVTFGGNAAIHYDHALGRITKHAPYRAGEWRSVDDPVRRAELLRLVDR